MMVPVACAMLPWDLAAQSADPASAPDAEEAAAANANDSKANESNANVTGANAPTAHWPAEEVRFNQEVFRTGLRDRGLTEILELHLHEFPPATETATLRMLRELKLAQTNDPALSPEAKLEVLREVNRITEQLLEKAKDDSDRFQWRFELVRSLLYDEGEPYFTRILFLGGSPTDRPNLRTLTSRALSHVEILREHLRVEYERFDTISVGAFERLKRSGYIEQIDTLVPRTQYLLLWALFHDCVARDAHDPIRAENLTRLRSLLAEQSSGRSGWRGESGAQVQGLLLSGMVHRRLGDAPKARFELSRSIEVYEGMDEQAPRDRLSWAMRLAYVELVRAHADDGRFEDAFLTLERFRGATSRYGAQSFGLQIVESLLSRTIWHALADQAARRGQEPEAARYREMSWSALHQLAAQGESQRDEVYATLYGLLGPDAPVDRLDPFFQCAYLAGLIMDAGENSQRRRELLRRAVAVGRSFVAQGFGAGASLVPQVRYQTAVALYKLGALAEAAREFLVVAKEHADFSDAAQAAVSAVQIAYQLYDQERPAVAAETKRLYESSLAVLTGPYAHTDAADYYRFFYAQHLEEMGRFEEAAFEYGRVATSHVHHLESMYLRVRCLALDLEEYIRSKPDSKLKLQNKLDAFMAAHRDFLRQVSVIANGHGEAGDARRAVIRQMAASARVLLAEVQVLPGVDRHAQALETLAQWEASFPNMEYLLARVWRVRLVAYERLGLFEEAAQAVPSYVAADSEDAGATLQSLYLALVDEIERLDAAGNQSDVKNKARMALIVARQICDWALRQGFEVSPGIIIQTKVQLAEANLRAGEVRSAHTMFEEMLHEDSPLSDGPSIGLDPRVLGGYAESLYRLERYGEALPVFNRLATQLPPDEPRRWHALARDLQCRTRLGEPPDGIIRVIQQQQFLHPQLGGSRFAPWFQQLLRDNQRRAAELNSRSNAP